MTASPQGQLVHVHTHGPVPHSDVTYARARIRSALKDTRDPVLFVRARLGLQPDPAIARPAIVQVNVDLDGRLVRAQSARPTLREAVDDVHHRLRERLRRTGRDWESIRGSLPQRAEHEWRHGTSPVERPHYFPLTPEQRRIARHKTFALGCATVEEAAFDMDMLDYGFHLFVEDGSGVDSVLYRTDGPPGYRLAQLDPQPGRVTPGSVPYTVSPHPPPELRADQAVDRLEVTGWPFVFFRDARSGRGCIVYHRYDGHYGVITPGD